MEIDFDINNTVKNIINDYINPTYPLYKVTYVHSWIENSDDDDLPIDINMRRQRIITSKVRTRIMECKNLADELDVIHISSNGYFIPPKTVEQFKENGYVTDYYPSLDHITIINLERIA
tara:strand:+ start:262 stop:618 length:357 start_codon:yes stop_codon:yes gene_type:complete